MNNRRPTPYPKEIYTDAAKTSSRERVCVPPRVRGVAFAVESLNRAAARFILRFGGAESKGSRGLQTASLCSCRRICSGRLQAGVVAVVFAVAVIPLALRRCLRQRRREVRHMLHTTAPGNTFATFHCRSNSQW
jgi:hypothetical protein